MSERDALAASYDYGKLAAEFHEKGYLTGLKIVTDKELKLLQDYVAYLTACPAVFNRNFWSHKGLFQRDGKANILEEGELEKGDTVVPFTEPRLPEMWVNYALEHPLMWDIVVMNPVVARLCKALWQTDDVQHLSTTGFTKNPAEPGKKPSEIGWHQDLRFWSLTPDKLCTVWLALDGSDAETGALKVVEGSHAGGAVKCDVDAFDNDGGKLLKAYQDSTPSFDETKIKTLELQPGQCSVHDGWTMHSSGPNTSQTRRRTGLTLQLMPGEVVVSMGEQGESKYTDFRIPIMVAGTDALGEERVSRGGIPLRESPWAVRDWKTVAR